MNQNEVCQLDSKSIFIIEDDDAIRESLQELLVEEGYSVTCAENGKHALELIDASKIAMPCLVLLDLNMPVMSGDEFLVKVRKIPEWKDTAVAVFTAAGNKAKPELATDFIKKPINIDELLEIVQRYC